MVGRRILIPRIGVRALSPEPLWSEVLCDVCDMTVICRYTPLFWQPEKALACVRNGPSRYT